VITIASDYVSAPESFDRYKARACAKVVLNLLHCNPESRKVTLKYYQLAFGPNLQNKPIYFNFETDSLCIINEEALRSFIGFWGTRSRPHHLLVNDVVSKDSRVRTIIVRGKLPRSLPSGVFRYHAVTSIVFEHPAVANVRLEEKEYVPIFNLVWTFCFGKECDCPKILFHTREEIDNLVEVYNYFYSKIFE
jgi:hypothetical protein